MDQRIVAGGQSQRAQEELQSDGHGVLQAVHRVADAPAGCGALEHVLTGAHHGLKMYSVPGRVLLGDSYQVVLRQVSDEPICDDDGNGCDYDGSKGEQQGQSVLSHPVVTPYTTTAGSSTPDKWPAAGRWLMIRFLGRRVLPRERRAGDTER